MNNIPPQIKQLAKRIESLNLEQQVSLFNSLVTMHGIALNAVQALANAQRLRAAAKQAGNVLLAGPDVAGKINGHGRILNGEPQTLTVQDPGAGVRHEAERAGYDTANGLIGVINVTNEIAALLNGGDGT